jgi:hypothetical protein
MAGDSESRSFDGSRSSGVISRLIETGAYCRLASSYSASRLVSLSSIHSASPLAKCAPSQAQTEVRANRVTFVSGFPRSDSNRQGRPSEQEYCPRLEPGLRTGLALGPRHLINARPPRADIGRPAQVERRVRPVEAARGEKRQRRHRVRVLQADSRIVRGDALAPYRERYPPRPIDFECERVRASRIQRVP